MRIGIDYQPARTHAPGVGRYARELVRALVRLDKAPDLRLLEFGREPVVMSHEALGIDRPTGPLIRHRIPLPRRAASLLSAAGLSADRLLGGVDLFQQVRLQMAPVSRAKNVLTVSELPPVGHAGVAAVRAAIAGVDHFLVFSAHYRRRLQDELEVNGDRVTQVPVGCDHWVRDLAGAALERIERIAREDPPVVLVLGAPRPERGHRAILAACERLIAGGQPLSLRIIGRRAHADEFAATLANSPMRRSVDWLPPDERALPRQVAEASLLVHLNDADEGTAVTPMEALVVGTPVLASRLPAFEETVDGAADLIDQDVARDPERLADAISRALTAERDEDARARRIATAAPFTWAKNAEATVRAWSQVLALVSLICFQALLPGCGAVVSALAPGDRLWFPKHPASILDDGGLAYDTDFDGRVDFEVHPNKDGVLDILSYDDDKDGSFDREVRISDHRQGDVPHLILLMDSIPYRVAKPRYEEGGLRFFREPVKVIAPFPSMSVVIFGDILDAPRMPGAVERYLDLDENIVVNDFVGRALGHQHAWHRMLDWYLRNYVYVGSTYVQPTEFIRYEAFETAAAVARDHGPVCVTYISSSSGMASVLGLPGVLESLDVLEQLCAQLLFETEGAIRISVISDHGHNLTPSSRFDPEEVLEQAGFKSVDGPIDFDREVFVELNGLVTYFGVQTGRPREVCDALLARHEVKLTLCRDGDSVRIRDALGAAVVERRGRRIRYRALDRDVLGYAAVVSALRLADKVDADGFVDRDDWLVTTADHEFPDAPRRVLDAFDGQVHYPCRVMCTLNDGYHAGILAFESIVAMQSTHGGLSQIHSDAVLLTMNAGVSGPLRSHEVLPTIEPRYDAWARRRRGRE